MMRASPRRPDFFIVGAPRCGTTALYTFLKQHPEVFMADDKEPHFFATDLYYPSFVRNPDDYLRLFSAAGDRTRLGEASVWYLYSCEAVRRIKDFAGHARVIAMLRNPVDMMYSYYCQAFYYWSRVYKGCEDLPTFRAALDAEADRKAGRRLPKDSPPGVSHFYYLYYRDMPRYASQLERYLTTLGRERVHVIVFDEFKKEPARVYRETCKFLEVDPGFQPAFETVNETKRVRLTPLVRLALYPPPALRAVGKRVIPRGLWRRFLPKLLSAAIRSERPPEMDPGLRKELQAEFAPEVEKVSRLLNRDLTYWSRN